MLTSLLMNLADLRWLIVFSPIATAIAWGMLVYVETNLQDPWRF
ncbi:MAG: hypothetical protein AAGA60_28125 [Cyanobacteria bacterium P01_E01_bin.42]